MASVTTTTAANDIDQMWTPELNRAVDYDIVIAALFEDKSNLLTHGSILNMPSQSHLTANTKNQGSDATPEAPTQTTQTFTVSSQKIVAQEIEDLVAIQSRYDLRAEFTWAAAYALARVMDVDASLLFDDNSTQQAGVLGSALTEDNLLTARAYLRNAGAKPPFNAVVAPATYNGLLKIDRFSSDLYVSAGNEGKAVEQAKLGVIYGMQFYESQLTFGTSPSSAGSVWAKGHFFKIIQRRPTTHTWYSPLATSWIVSMDCVYGMFERQEANEGAAVVTNARLWSVYLLSAK